MRLISVAVEGRMGWCSVVNTPQQSAQSSGGGEVKKTESGRESASWAKGREAGVREVPC